jgi:hypothetical protein
MQEIIAPMRDEAITPAPDKGPRRRKRRWKTAALLFVTTLGLGSD